MSTTKEQYIVSARKYRPATFHSVVGQDSLTNTLKNAIKNKHLAHAYLFCGPRGVGKTTCARIFAKTINCYHLTESGEACNECESCVSFNEGRSLNIFEMDAASNNSVDDIRGLVQQVMVPPQIGKYRVYIIDEVHMLSQAAFNAFLKTLEEPPEYAIFILATTEKHKILPTIISRCQVYDFNRIQIADTVKYLQYIASNEGITAEEEALKVIAEKADGGMRDALSIFDQIVSYEGGEAITYKDVIQILNVLDYEYYFSLVNWFLAGDIVSSMLCLDTIISKGFDLQNFVSGLANHLRDLFVAKNKQSLPLLEVSDSVKIRYEEQAREASIEFIFHALKLASECELGYKTSTNKRLLVEIALMKMCQIIKPLSQPTNQVSQSLQPINSGIPQAQNSNFTQPPLPQTNIHLAKPTTKLSIRASLQPNDTNKVESSQKDCSKTNDLAQTAPTQSINDDFTEESLKEAWGKYKQGFEGDGFSTKYIDNASPKKQGLSCVLKVISEQQAKFFSERKIEIEAFLRRNLNCKDLSISIEKEEIKITQSISPEDTLQDMIKENPNLQKLISTLDLEIRY